MAAKPTASRPIGIVAGGGGIVDELIKALENKSRPFVVAAIKGEADEGLKTDTLTHFKWGEIGRMISFFHQHNCEELILIGRVNQRPDFRSIIGDPETLKRIPKIVAAMTGGDDSLLQRVIKLIEVEGFTIIGVQEAAPELLLEKGLFGYTKLNGALSKDAHTGKAILKDLGKHDIGQALVIHEGRVLAVEGAEGTDNMLRRIRQLREEKRITQKKRTGILLKAAKPHQDLRADLPTIGLETIRLAAQAGLAGIICEAGRVLVADREETFEQAKLHKILLVGECGFRDE